MKCIYCGFSDSKVIDSRPLDDGQTIRRRRECLECGRRFTTYEKAELLPVMVIKKDNSREPFDINKIKRGVLKACEKRSIPMAKIENMLNNIEKQIYNGTRNEIPVSEIGEMVMDELKAIDEVAYVRFASVYRQFKDIGTFINELNKLIVEK